MDYFLCSGLDYITIHLNAFLYISEKSRNFCKGSLETSGSCCHEVVVGQGKRMDRAEHM